MILRFQLDDRIAVWLAKIILCCGFFLIGLFIIQETGNLAVMILDREKVYSNPKKQLVVLFDGKDVNKRLESYNITLEEIVKNTNDVFSIANLLISYDPTSVKRRYIKLDSQLAKIHPFEGLEDRLFWKEEVRVSMNKFDFADRILNTVTLVLTDKIKLGNGFIYKWSSNGDGTIIMGTGLNPLFESKIGVIECGFIGCFPRSAKLTYLRVLSGTLAHEQGHLYGIYHSDDKNSIMYPYTNYQTENYVVFDDSSAQELHRAVRKFIF